MNKTKILIFLTFLFVKANCQEKVTLYFNENWEVTKKEKAIYSREAEFDLEKLELNGKVTDTNLLGQPIMTGNYSAGKRDGEFTIYFPNGKMESKGCYQKNRRTGKWEYFYADGKPKQTVIFMSAERRDDFIVVDYFDRNGKQFVKNGTGKWVNDSVVAGLFDRINPKRLTGQFKDSLKVGEWKLVQIDNGKLVHSERFSKGKFISAVAFSPASNEYGTMSSEVMLKFPDVNEYKFKVTESFDLDTTSFPQSVLNADVETIFKTLTGKEYKIKNRKVMYPEGDYDLLEFIASNIRYPVSAMEGKISGKVYIGAFIDAKGNLKEAKVLFGVQNALDNEALRVVRLIKKWLPELVDGNPVESTLTIPISFVLKE